MLWALYLFFVDLADRSPANCIAWSTSLAREGGDNLVPLDGLLNHCHLWRLTMPEPAARSARRARVAPGWPT